MEGREMTPEEAKPTCQPEVEKFLEEGNKNWMMKTMKTEMKQALDCIRELLARFPAPTCSEQEAAVETAKEILLKHDWYNSNNGISPLHV